MAVMQGGISMLRGKRSIPPVLLAIACLGLLVWLVTNDGNAPARAESTSEKPSKIEPIEGSNFKRVTLSQKASDRLGVQTTAVRDEQVGGAARKVVPYTAVLYGINGETWAYTNPEPLVFVRQSITVERIEGDMAILSDGPPSDTPVVVVGASLLYGAETGIGK
jgi:hypothetical protein